MGVSLPEIIRLDLAELQAPEGHPYAGETTRVHAFVIAHPRGAILVDSGLGMGNRLIDQAYQPRHHPVIDALREHGLHGDDIVAIANTHLHFDHCGGNSSLPGRPIYVQRSEYEASKTPFYTVVEWVDFAGADIHVVDGEHELAPGVRLVPTPGHTPGHQSVLIEAGDRRALICGQAAYTAAEFGSDPNETGATMGLVEEYRDSFARMRALEPQQVHFSHDTTIWTPDNPA